MRMSSESCCLSTVATGIVTNAVRNTKDVLYSIQMANKLLRPQQLKVVKNLVVSNLCKIK